MAGNFLSEWTSPSNARLVGYVIVPWRVFHLSRDSSKDFFRTNLNHQFIREVRYTLYCCRSFVEFHTYWQTIILFDTPMVIVLVELRVQEFTSNGNSRKQRGIRRHKNHLKNPWMLIMSLIMRWCFCTWDFTALPSHYPWNLFRLSFLPPNRGRRGKHPFTGPLCPTVAGSFPWFGGVPCTVGSWAERNFQLPSLSFYIFMKSIRCVEHENSLPLHTPCLLTCALFLQSSLFPKSKMDRMSIQNKNKHDWDFHKWV